MPHLRENIGDLLVYKISDTVFPKVADSVPDPDPHVFGPPGSGSTSHRYGSGSGSDSSHLHAKKVRKTLIPSIL
jgi:hypothetical protein